MKIAIRCIVSLFLIGAIMLLPAMALGSGMSDADDSGTNKEGTSDGQMDDKQMVNSCTEKAENANMFGVFSTENGIVDGRFIAFNYANGALSNYTLKTDGDILIISSLVIEDFEPSAEPKTAGAIFMMNGTNSQIICHNNPTGAIQITAPKDNADVKLVLKLAPGLSLEKNSNGTYTIVGISIRAYLRLGGVKISINGSSIEVAIGETGHLKFMSVPANGYGGSEYRYKYTKSVMNGSIDSELDIVTSKGKSLAQKFNYEGKVEMKLKSMERNRLKIIVSSEEHKGKVVAIGIDKDSMGNSKKDQLRVKLDGESLKKASGMEEVIDSSGDKGKYWLEEHAGGYHALVYVPEFSEHELVIEQASVKDDSTSSPIPDISLVGIVIAILIGLTLVIWKRKRF